MSPDQVVQAWAEEYRDLYDEDEVHDIIAWTIRRLAKVDEMSNVVLAEIQRHREEAWLP